jgi:phenylalanyl-tRNA synthetase beta chain
MRDSPDILKNLQLFDVYMGEGIDSEKKSVALGLIFQGTSSTLVDTDVESLMEGIRLRLVEVLGATLR